MPRPNPNLNRSASVLWVALALSTGCASKQAPALSLQGAIQTAPVTTTGCPWSSVGAVRLERDTIWVADAPWGVATREGAEAFARILGRCGLTNAVSPFRAWRHAEAQAVGRSETLKQSAETLGTLVVAAAASAIADSDRPPHSPDGLVNQLASATTPDPENLREPQPLPPTDGPSPALVRARQALIDAIVQAPSAPPATSP